MDQKKGRHLVKLQTISTLIIISLVKLDDALE